MRWLCLIHLLILPLSTHATELWLRVGEVRLLEAPSGKAVRIGSRGVIKVIDGESSVRVVGLKPGFTPLVIGDRNYLVRVSFGHQKDFLLNIQLLFTDMMGLQLNVEEPNVTVRGTLLRFSDWLRIHQLAEKYQGEYTFAAQALPDVADQALRHLTQLAHEKGYPIVRFRATPQFSAQIPRAAGSLKNNAAALFKSYGIRVESTDSELMIQPLIRTRVILAEVSKNEAQDFGVSWPSEYKVRMLPQLGNTDDNVMLTLRALEARGQAQILASPNLICRSGGEAKFHAGGQFPIRIFSRLAHDVTWKQHGVLLKVKPQADFQGAMSLEIETEVSLLDMANAVDGIPALKSNTVKSHFDLPGKRTIALSGLLRQELGESREGLPWLNKIPVLGALFSSQKFLKRQTELVIFVTPEIHVPDSDEKIEMPAGWVRDEA
jgi:pilus assembly protein CpaC